MEVMIELTDTELDQISGGAGSPLDNLGFRLSVPPPVAAVPPPAAQFGPGSLLGNLGFRPNGN
jgi:bacteriocin-like protein